jgi:hypothetical protein
MSTIITKNSATSGSTPPSLIQGELAINVTDGRLFYGSGSGNVVKEFTGSASGGTTIDTGSFVTTSSFNAYTGSNTSQFAGTASYATNALTASYAEYAVSASYTETASYAPAYLPLTGGTINGDVTVNGTASIAFLNVSYESASVIYSSGSNQFGDASNDVQTLWGTVDVKTGPVLVTGSLDVSGGITGSLLGTASYAVQALSSSHALTASYVNPLYQTVQITGSLTTTGSNIFIGNQTVTGSLFTTGSNTLVGNTVLSGTLQIQGQYPPSAGSESVSIVGNVDLNGYLRFDPVTSNTNNSISASYIYVSGSTNDLYFSQNGDGYSNTTRLRWLEGNIYTGILTGGVVSGSIGGTTFNVSSGSGIIVTLNATTASIEPYPTIEYVQWPSFTNITPTFLNIQDTTWLGIDSNGNLIQQANSFYNGQFDDSLQIGSVIHPNLSTISLFKTFTVTSYGIAQQTYEFIRSFGAIKVSGHTISPSGSSLSVNRDSGVAFALGRNYINDANKPSLVNDASYNAPNIFRYYKSGSVFVTSTGTATVDPAQYNTPTSPTGLSPTPGGQYTIQRIFYFPNQTNTLGVYYGRQTYNSISTALANLPYETFEENNNTLTQAIFVAYLIVKGGTTNLSNTSDAQFIQAGTFRNTTSGGGGASTISLDDLSDVVISNVQHGDLLTYDGAEWVNLKQLTGSYGLTGSLTATSFTGSLQGTATTASYVLQAVSASFATSSSRAVSASFATTASYVLQAVSASYATQALSSSFASTATSASYALNATNATTASYVLNAVSASFATLAQTANTASYVVTAQTASYVLNAVSASFASTASYVNQLNQIVRVGNDIELDNQIGAVVANSFDAGLGNVFIDGLTGDVAATSFTAGGGAIQIDGITGEVTATTFIGDLTGTASYATQALSASWAPAGNPFPYTGSAEITGSLGVTGSFNLQTFNGLTDVTALDFSGVTRAINDVMGSTSINADDRDLYDSSAINSVNWEIRRLIDTSTSRSIDWENRYLQDSAGTATVDWAFTALYGNNATYALNWNDREAYDSAEVIAISWDARRLIDSSGVIVMRWDQRLTYDTVNSQSIDWNNRQLKFDNGTSDYTVDWNEGILQDTAANASIDWQNRQLKNSSGNEVLNWNSGVAITGSLTVSGSSTFTNIGPAQFSGSFGVQGAGDGFTGPFTAITIDDANFTRTLHDSQTGASSLDFGNRSLVDGSGNFVLSWDGTVGYINSELYSNSRINATTRNTLLTFNVSAGQTLDGVTFDSTVADFDLVYLETDGTWYPVEQSTASSTKLLGICLGYDPMTYLGTVILEGDVSVSTSPGSAPVVDNANYGLPVYIAYNAGNTMDTTIPVNGYVRVLGHCYYSDGGSNWIMKFRPSNDWIEI